MIIGVDAKWYYNGPPSGKVVIRNLVEKLIEHNPGHKLIFFLDKNHKEKIFPFKNKNVQIEYIWAKNNLLSNLFILPKVAKKLHVDVLLYQNFPSITKAFKQIAYIHDIIFLTNPEFYTFRERLYFTPLKFLARYSNLLCTVSYSEKERIVENYKISPEKIDVIYHGVNKIFKPIEEHDGNVIKEVREKYGLPEQFLLYVGRLNVRKNVFNLFKAYAQLDNKNIPLVVVGGYDWKMEDVEKSILELNIKDKIIFTGPIYGSDLSVVYALSKVFCFPSYEESFGLPALEAMASGIPVVVSNSSSLPEICGDAGVYVNAFEPKDIAEKIDMLIDNPKLYNEKSKKAILQANKFSWDHSAKKLYDSFDKTLGIL